MFHYYYQDGRFSLIVYHFVKILYIIRLDKDDL